MLHPKHSRHLIHPFPPNSKSISTPQTQPRIPFPPRTLRKPTPPPTNPCQVHPPWPPPKPPQAQPRIPFSSLLELCKNPRHLQQIHARFILHGHHQNPTLSSKLIDAYANLHLPTLSQQVFYSLTTPDLTAYNAFLRKCYHFGEFKKSLSVYQEMLKNSVYPDELTYPLVLKSCTGLSDVGFARKIRGQVLKLGFESYDLVGSGLAEMHGKICDGDSAHELFEKRPLNCLVQPYSVNIINLLRESVDLNSLIMGKIVHCLILMRNFWRDLSVNTALLTMYSKLGCSEDARLLFDKMPERDCVVWNLMIAAYSRSGCSIESLKLLAKTVRSGTRADMFTAIATLSSIGELKCLKRGKEMHAHVIRNGSDYQIYDAFSIFMKMKLDGFKVDSITVINVLPACVNVGVLEQVKYLHGYSVKGGLYLMQSVNTALLVSYAKCGCIEIARKLFDEEEITSKDIITWNSMINAYSKHGNSIQCFELYNQIRHSKLKPDRHTFLGMLTACVNSGCVTEGWECFKEMTEKYGCQPNQEHYACMIDLLGRTGRMREASELIKFMPFEPDARVLGPLLSACKLHPNTRVAKMRTFLRDRGLKKNPGCSWLEINGKVHEFRVADRSHPLSDDIYAILADIEMEITDFKYRSSGKKL
ncbi:hypothetical protein RJ640_000233 [Escallonia rubra]|uniref:Pentatricopeptide repeat-containing protein n=1 Tax=Escallonia rubra TaxID=112253 RepID=A0AA88S292_9ASTE|nr:hypothetical protein RJ640_000233 [Escallonia rubra]